MFCVDSSKGWKPYKPAESAEIEKAYTAVRYDALRAFVLARVCSLTSICCCLQQGSGGSHTLTGGKYKIDFGKMRQQQVANVHKSRAVRRVVVPGAAQGAAAEPEPEPEPESGDEPAEMPTGL